VIISVFILSADAKNHLVLAINIHIKCRLIFLRFTGFFWGAEKALSACKI